MLRQLARVLSLCSIGAVAIVPAQNPPTPAQTEQQKPPEAPPAAPKVEPAGPAPTSGLPPVDPKTFIIGAEDSLAIQVWREPEFSRQVMVRPDGKITMPLIKEVQAAGRTPEQLGEELAKSLSEYLRAPEVSVTVIQVNSQKYYVTGEVNRPGPYPLIVPTKVLDAITNAGGFHEFANQKKIVIMRKDERLKFNYKEVIKGKNPEQNILLENGDYIIVP